MAKKKKIKNTKMSDEDMLRSEVSSRISELDGYHSTTYEYIEDQMRFHSGDQWDSEVKNSRIQEGLPVVTLPVIQTYTNNIINPLRINPIGMRVSTDDEGASTLLSGLLREIEEKSRAKEAYEQAHEHQVISGLGWIKVDLVYKNGTDLDQEIRIDIVRDQCSIMIDPLSKQSDGSDARYGAYVGFMNEDEAKEKYGEDIGQCFSSVDLYHSWSGTIPDNTVCELIYYKIDEAKTDKYWYQDGTVSEGELVEGKVLVGQRKISKKTCKMYKFVGQKLVGEAELPLPYIPLVPVYGDRLVSSENGSSRLGGIVHWTQDSQRSINLYAANEKLQVAIAPKVPIMMVDGQKEGFEADWDNINNANPTTIEYNMIIDERTGVVAPPPSRLGNELEIQSSINGRLQAQQDLGRSAGIFDAKLGGQTVGPGMESGLAALNRSTNSEITTAHYTQNLQHSIEQVARICIHLIPYAYDTEKMVTFRDETGNKSRQMIDMSKVVTPGLIENMDIDFTAGPMLMSQRKEAVSTMIGVGQLMPDKMPVMADILMRNLDSPGSREIAERFEKMLPPELKMGDQGPDPQAQAMLQQADAQIQAMSQTVEQYEAIIRELQAKLQNEEADRKVDMAQKVIDSETKLAVEKMKQNGMDGRQDQQIMADTMQSIGETASSVISSEPVVDVVVTPGPEDFVPQTPGPLAFEDVPDTLDFSDEGDDTLVFE